MVSRATLDVIPLTPTIGAEVRGADLTAFDDAQLQALRGALIEHQVVFLRDQPALSPAQQVAVGERFGALHTHPAAPHLEHQPEVFVIHTHEGSRVANGNGWHTDVSCDEEPPLATLLQIHQLPSSGGDTLFASAYAAYETLSPAMQAMLGELSATHESEHVYRGRYADRGVDDTGRVYPAAVHPVLRTHPDSGRCALYVNRAFTTRINELKPAESQALLEMLFSHLERPEFQVRFQWSENALAIWDNRCTQHFALWDYWPEERRGHRVTVAGERPYFDRLAPGAGQPAGRHRRLGKTL